ncbi:MAG: rRNA maturation RNase YbeY [Phaeovulum sp.]|uniref:rRNA maturation RNase YbeY n=1 Tax=Phaeovulum sp. TaxID=2934796 RepID=UPI00272F58B6|nr:rRNA maturation RNase YbeY [Phaeovulum sp.]MDP2061746.1 rRNA maturation RNase YbeY [Phaeovulum sp.]
MALLVDIVFEDDRWQALGLQALADAAAGAVLADQRLSGDFEISLLACDDARIAALNADFRGKATATNVLSWPAEALATEEDGATPFAPDAEDPMGAELGDIAIAWETCAREAAEQGKEIAAHVSHLLVHGVLHLLGYDHIREKDAALMEACELRILASLGVADPYDIA